MLYKYFVVFFVSASVFFATANASKSDADGYTIKVGRITSNPHKNYGETKVFSDFISNRLAHVGVTGGEVVFARNVDEMARFVDQGKVDVISDSLYPQLQLRKRSGVELIAMEHRDGMVKYSTVIFTRKDSPVNILADLRNRKVALEDNGSTSSYFVPRVLIESMGATMIEGEPVNDQVGYVFARDEINISKWVHSGRVDAGAFSSKDWNSSKRMPPALKADLRIIHQSAEFPRSLLSVRTGLDSQIKSAIRRLFLNQTLTDKDKREIYPYREVTGFSPIKHQDLAWFEASTWLK